MGKAIKNWKQNKWNGEWAAIGYDACVYQAIRGNWEVQIEGKIEKLHIPFRSAQVAKWWAEDHVDLIKEVMARKKQETEAFNNWHCLCCHADPSEFIRN